MISSSIAAEARIIIARNLTPNVAGADIEFFTATGHFHLTYYLDSAATDADQEERELALCELIAAFPAIRTAASAFGSAAEMPDKKELIFRRP
ncbi:MAG: hypothetical protein ACRECY_13840 [Phyllobacterium sp.]